MNDETVGYNTKKHFIGQQAKVALLGKMMIVSNGTKNGTILIPGMATLNAYKPAGDKQPLLGGGYCNIYSYYIYIYLDSLGSYMQLKSSCYGSSGLPDIETKYDVTGMVRNIFWWDTAWLDSNKRSAVATLQKAMPIKVTD
jgi:hypothetical protein